MRPRSRGVSCQSFSELVETVNAQSAPKQETNSEIHPQFSDIQTYLQSQQLEPQTIDNEYQYFLFDADRLKAEEENELSKKPQVKMIRIGIGLVCSSINEVQKELLKQPIIAASNKFELRYKYIQSQQTETEIELKKSASQVNSDSSSSSQNFQHEEEKLVLHKNRTSKEEHQNTLETQQLTQSITPLQLVIYYNQQSKNIYSNKNEKDSPDSYQFQHKIWLIQHQQQYSQIMQLYLRKCKHLFRVSLHQKQLLLQETSLQQILKQKESSNKEVQFWSAVREIETKEGQQQLAKEGQKH